MVMISRETQLQLINAVTNTLIHYEHEIDRLKRKIDRLQYEAHSQKVVPGTNIPDADTPVY
jgi:hypothetical protein